MHACICVHEHEPADEGKRVQVDIDMDRMILSVSQDMIDITQRTCCHSEKPWSSFSNSKFDWQQGCISHAEQVWAYNWL